MKIWIYLTSIINREDKILHTIIACNELQYLDFHLIAIKVAWFANIVACRILFKSKCNSIISLNKIIEEYMVRLKIKKVKKNYKCTCKLVTR